ncbi:MAG: rhamnopyranosyl-N-acetylglucosaminyl-diphospho-decaprenol beta,3/1,4-galactofuranosyltransferase [Patescibacteria group bacterium]|nr:rhamnopyranosyl-N-acetylglucosaminyl-diphospho-decaprenol beta,3/1,4-galactofuranosyltransferase [Patescibacteria group bacterium]
MEYPRLLFVSVAGGRRDRLEKCVSSLEGQSRAFDDVIFVDAASHEGVSEWMQRSYPFATVLRLFQSHGVAHAFRQACKSALQRVPEDKLAESWIWFSRPDRLFAPDAVQKLAEQCKKYPTSVFLGPGVYRAWQRGEESWEGGEEELTEYLLAQGTVLTRGFALCESPEGAPGLQVTLEGGVMRADVLRRLLDAGAVSDGYATLSGCFADLSLMATLHDTVYRPELLLRVWRYEKGEGRPPVRSLEEADRRQLVRRFASGGLWWKTLPWRIMQRLRSSVAPEYRRVRIVRGVTVKHESLDSALWSRMKP